MRYIRLWIRSLLCNMGNRDLGDHETDWNLLFNYFSAHAADGLCFVLDGTQPARYFKLFWHFSFHICRSVARTIYGRYAQCQKTERNIDQKAGCWQGIVRGSRYIDHTGIPLYNEKRIRAAGSSPCRSKKHCKRRYFYAPRECTI